MADTALDTRINPYLEKGPIEWELPSDAPAAQPNPPRSYAQGPQGDATPDAQPGALRPTAPPSVTPGVTPQPAFDDENEFKTGLQLEADQYQRQLLSHKTGRPIQAPGMTRVEDHPNFPDLQEMANLIPQMPPKEQKAAQRTLTQLRSRYERETNAKNKTAQTQFTAQQRDELTRIDAPYEDVKKRGEMATILQGQLENYATKYQTDAKSADPKTSQSADYTFKTSPLSTLRPEQARDAATTMAALNPHMQADAAMRYLLAFGSPVDIREKADTAGLNGVKGKGGTNYKVLGRDARDNYLLQAADGNIVRVLPQSYREITQARVAGYTAAKQWLGDMTKQRAEAAKPGLVERTYKRFTGQ